MNRRAILKGALGGVVGLTLPPFARDAFSQASPAVVPVSDGFVMLTGAGSNILVRTASAGQVLVDGGAVGSTDAVLKRLRELPGAGRQQDFERRDRPILRILGAGIEAWAGAAPA